MFEQCHGFVDMQLNSSYGVTVTIVEASCLTITTVTMVLIYMYNHVRKTNLDGKGTLLL